MTKSMSPVLCATLLAGCATIPSGDRALPIGRPSKFNADPDRYDHKVVFIRAYLSTSPHWWQFALYEFPRGRDKNCLSFQQNDWVLDNRYEVDHELLLLKGTFIKDITLNSVYGGCYGNNNGFVIDEKFLKKRYGARYRR